jgi:hypothetical protein
MNAELTLWCHVLQQAIWDVAGVKAKLPNKEIPRLQRSARAWFLSSDQDPGSFLWICHTLSFDVDAVRKRVLTASPAQLSALIADVPSALTQSPNTEANSEAEGNESQAAVGF